jgi:hypothetical protein
MIPLSGRVPRRASGPSRSRDNDGGSSPPRLRALPVAMWFISLSQGVIFMWSWALYLFELVDVTLHLLCYSSGFISVISGDTLSHDVKLTVCASCVALRLKFTVILIMSYDLSWMSLWIVVFVWNHLVHSRWQCGCYGRAPVCTEEAQ